MGSVSGEGVCIYLFFRDKVLILLESICFIISKKKVFVRKGYQYSKKKEQNNWFLFQMSNDVVHADMNYLDDYIEAFYYENIEAKVEASHKILLLSLDYNNLEFMLNHGNFEI